MGILALLVIVTGLAVIGAAGRGEGAAFVGYGLTATGAAYAGYGCWMRHRSAQIIAIAEGALLVFYALYTIATATVLQRLAGTQDFAYLVLVLGVAVGGLVVVPASSRSWFTAPARESLTA
jgi:hypothetical protein